jgi:subtilisin-like proprotein convertase family protein
MRGWNNVGGTGVAPMASLIGYNYITSQTLNPLIASLGYGSPALNLDTGSEQAHIFNMSFGILPTGDEIYNSNSHDYNFSDLLRCGTTGNQLRFQPTTGSITAGIGFIINCNTLNSGKGALYIKSSGNGFNDPACPTTNANISCDLVNGFEVSEGTPYVMVVGAFNADGERSSYSSSGPALWISAPGGESGYSNEAFTPLNDRSTSSTNYRWGNDILTKSAMVTTDVPGCNKGYSENSTSVTHIDGQTYTFPVTPFHGILRFSITSTGTSIEPHPENRNCNYVSTFNGNSSTDSVASGSAGVSGSAAPVVSGVAALILSANSDLYWRDVRYILAKTARKVDTDSTAYSIRLSDGTQVLRKGWSTNTAGFSFHHWYGFGAVDAEAAVNMAKTYTDYLNNNMFIQGEWIDGVIDSSASTITDNSINGVTGTVTVLTQGMEWIEGVQIRLSATHTNVSDLTAKLISPSGTESIILRAFNSLGSNDDFTDTLMYSNEFYRETIIDGTWQLVITDNSTGETGKATGWKIRFFGQKSP